VAPLFDSYIMVDWSAASRPRTGKDSIWIGRCNHPCGSQQTYACWNPATRMQARSLIEALLDEAANCRQKTLIGFDFAFGYPAGTASALGLTRSPGPPWKLVQQLLGTQLVDHADNQNNRFELAARLNADMTGTAHPFWGVPKSRLSATLQPCKGDFSQSGSLSETRCTDRWLRQVFGKTPKSVWQLLGIGSVGSQTLTGLATLSHLRSRYKRSRIWPFETGLVPMTKSALVDIDCVFAEIYPSLLLCPPEAGEVQDAAQMRCLCTYFQSLDQAGQLSALFAAPDSLEKGKIHQIEAEEGWILAKNA